MINKIQLTYYSLTIKMFVYFCLLDTLNNKNDMNNNTVNNFANINECNF